MSLVVPRPLPIPTDAAKAEEGRITPGAPPWLWLWVAIFIVSIPSMLALWQASFDQIAMIRDSSAALRAATGDDSYGRLNVLLYPAVLLDFLPSAALLVGLAAVLFPHARRRYVERRYDITTLPADDKRMGPTIREIEVFIQEHAPGLTMMWSRQMLLDGPLVFPLGYRQTAVAINATFLLWWKRDAAAAKAVLLHEIGHYRRGDAKIMGVGSLFVTVVKYALPAFLILFLIPTLILFVDRLMTANSEFSDLGIPVQSIWEHQIGQGRMQATELLATTGAYVFWFATFLVAPLTAIWAAEFNADRFAADRQGTASGVEKIVAMDAGKPWWKWILLGLAHPPAKLRLWMLNRRLDVALACLALLFPAAYLVRLLLLHGRAILTYFVIQFSPQDIWAETLDNSLWYFRTMPIIWGAMAAVLILWPFLVRRWEAAVTGEPGESSHSHVPVYWACAALLIVLVLLGLALPGFMDAPSAAGPKTL